VQNYLIVDRVPVMSVSLPAAGPGMDLDMAFLEPAASGDYGISKIRASVVIRPARVPHLDPIAFLAFEALAAQDLPP
jgi:hypothetical protein